VIQSLAIMRKRWADRPSQPKREWNRASPRNWSGSPLAAQVVQWDRLYFEGRVVWARLLKANRRLFRADRPSIAPGVWMWSPDPLAEHDPDWLERIHHRAADLDKRRAATPGLRAFAERQRNAPIVALRVPLPRHLTGGHVVFEQSLLFDSTLLPGGCVAWNSLPLVVAGPDLGTAMVLPPPFWADALRAEWEGG